MTPSLDFHSVVLYALSDVGEREASTSSLAFARHVAHRNTSIKFTFNHPHDGLETTTTTTITTAQH